MAGAADQKLANGGGGVPWGAGFPPVVVQRRGDGVKKKKKKRVEGAVHQLFLSP